MKGRLWLLSVFLLIVAAVFLAPARALTRGKEASKSSPQATGREAPSQQCSQVPEGREIEPPDPGQPLPGPICTASFCSQFEGVRCVAGSHCNGQNKDKCIYNQMPDASCIAPDPLPASWCGGCN